MESKMDIFPRYISNQVARLTYPSKNFENFKNDGRCKIFIMHLDRRNKFYYYKLDWTERYLAHMITVGKESQNLKDFYPEKINWATVSKRLEKDKSQQLRKNIDGRIGFKNGDKFLVKAYFSFGQRTVEPGTAHFVQTLNVPLVFYLNQKNFPHRLNTQNGIFPHNHLHLFDRRVLLPNGCYRIPPGTTYILLSTQKNFFSLNVIGDKDEISIPYVDPVATRVTKLVNIYDKPLKTPYIEDLEEESKNPDLEALFKTIQPPSVQPVEPMDDSPVFLEPFPVARPIETSMQQQTFYETSMQTTVHEPVQQTTFHEQPVQQSTFHEIQQTTFHEQPVQQQTTFHEPPQPTCNELNDDELTIFNDKVEQFLNRGIFYSQEPFKLGLQRNIAVASLDFVRYFQMMKNRQMDDPRSGFVPNNCGTSYPLDLSIARDDRQFNEQFPGHCNDEQQFQDFSDQLFTEIPDQEFNDILMDLYDAPDGLNFEKL